ncbi:putative pentatricopeptide repeat-containing protein At3g08820 [Phragmites australis]|uniref:putative pentatricopeptide repeat-containing protein At3g08820 n=1 Tax=Phragmites australis TaxID=29695 RepID=UPI002D770887|nr:putative pentatricopeptide repeat-containing protein At3g08820 [Phragmites australis]
MVYGSLGRKIVLPASSDEEAADVYGEASTVALNASHHNSGGSCRVVVTKPEWAGGLFDDLADDPTVAALSLTCTFWDFSCYCYTVVGALSACTRLGALDLGRRAVEVLHWDEFLDNPVLGTALIDMYAKCGSTCDAWTVFQQMRKRDIIVWNAMILGLGMTSHGKTALALVGQMEKSGMTLNDNTFIGLLCSCTHTGLVQDGRRSFFNMTQSYHISPRIEHDGCMVDLLSRAGLLEEAHQLIEDMPMQANAVVWGALLGGCKIHRDADLAEHVLKQLIWLEPWNSGNYAMLSNIYYNSGRWEDAAKLRLEMKANGVEKVPASSWVEFSGKVHEFHVGDKSHPLSDQIYAKLDELGMGMKAMGYKPTTEVVLFDTEDEEEEHTLVDHSEKIAIAFSLLTTGPGETIRVTKNLRVCSGCHTAIKLISRITHHEIIVRDNNRFHCFRDSHCSCNDYW